MNKNHLLDASCRVALAALLHDLGKFAERSGLALPDLAGNQAVYCPLWNGRYSHTHAAYTGLAIDVIENQILTIGTGDMSPFSARGDTQRKDDSLLNGAAMHHKPETPLQRIIASADRLASGFERSEFEDYNKAEEEQEEGREKKKVNHLRARQWPLLERIHHTGVPQHRFPLMAISPESLFPAMVPACNDEEARREYKQLWQAFVEGLEKIPSSHREDWPLWLDHFDSLFLTFTHAIPSATAMKRPGEGFLAIPSDVSLYDHSKTTAALAVALWRYHDAQESVETAFSAQWRWEESGVAEFILIQGDFFGIQNFIFSEGGKTAKHAAKLLRGKSFFVSLLTELAALKVLEAFDLPAVSQITNAAGKFLIVAPNLPDAEQRVQQVRAELYQWFLKNTFGQGGIGLATTTARRQDFKKKKKENPSERPFRDLMQRLFDDLDGRKRRRFDLCSAAMDPVFSVPFSDAGVCDFCGKAPAVSEWKRDAQGNRCLLCADQIRVGDHLVKKERVIISRKPVDASTLSLDYFGYRVTFTEGGSDSGHFTPLVSHGALLRAWDFSLPHGDGMAPLWHGYARRAISGYVPKGEEGIRDFEWIARCSIRADSENPDEKRGIAALGILKGDVDDLGIIFQQGLDQPTFARMAALSRQLNAFFAIWLPWYCAQAFPNTYTVFAGGDDFFLIGPWLEQIQLADAMSQAFARYVGHNPTIHFSAGLAVTKPGIPIPTLAAMAEESLSQAKAHGDGKEKNAITCWNRPVSWRRFAEIRQAEKELDGLVAWLKADQGVEMSVAYLYGLLHLCEKAESKRPEDAIWRSWFVYRTWRFVVDKLRNVQSVEERQQIYREQFAEKISKQITVYQGDYKIALFNHLYQRREAP